ncbi:hypothetical protein SAMN06265365_13736 [Tistlia consotensis]|uniref:Uncharacterized protein n=1 Tax=Tistlia consotensis USBA 355 TaxID=560819 RepID=A0A1Y6BW09_9PROT|nr:hypothetical protein [Tistlia consotensis]SMF30687.1 hypothetical protein SAMN05428998_110127 [Tistlia consotensis USBA 355]SNS19741.1 hypothetical protein SAMN06265365_13736 [Tistlia consotensis]
MTARVEVRDGAVYLPAALAETYFRGVDAVVLLIRGGALQVLPVRQAAAGGCLLKIRNAAGDRVAAAPDLFLAAGLGAWAAQGLEARWSSEAGALVVELPIQKLQT